MDLSEAKTFFAFVLDLDYHIKIDQQKFTKIMKIIDPNDTKIVTKEDVLNFFSIPGFLNLIKVEKFNSSNEQKQEEQIIEIRKEF